MVFKGVGKVINSISEQTHWEPSTSQEFPLKDLDGTLDG